MLHQLWLEVINDYNKWGLEWKYFLSCFQIHKVLLTFGLEECAVIQVGGGTLEVTEARLKYDFTEKSNSTGTQNGNYKSTFQCHVFR